MSGALMRIRKEEESRNSAAGGFSRTAGHGNHTGIPTQLKERVEQSTGMSLNDVRVHYNSILPAKLDALAYTKGNQVEISPGQERHLPHELGHVIQQKLGVVRANAVHSSGTLMNVDETLERQADEIGAGKRISLAQGVGEATVQRLGLVLSLVSGTKEKEKETKQEEEEEEEEEGGEEEEEEEEDKKEEEKKEEEEEEDKKEEEKKEEGEEGDKKEEEQKKEGEEEDKKGEEEDKKEKANKDGEERETGGEKKAEGDAGGEKDKKEEQTKAKKIKTAKEKKEDYNKLQNMSDTIKQQMSDDLLGLRSRYNNQSPTPGNFAVAYAYIYTPDDNLDVIGKKYNGFSKINIDTKKNRYLYQKSDEEVPKDDQIRSLFEIIDNTEEKFSGLPKQKRFHYLDKTLYTPDGNPNRTFDAEAKILENIDENIEEKFSNVDNDHIKGLIFLCSELAFCKNCQYIIHQFRERYENITLQVFYNDRNIQVNAESPEAGGSRLREFLILDEDMKLFQRLGKIEAILELLGPLASKGVPPIIVKRLRSEENMEVLSKCHEVAKKAKSIGVFVQQCTDAEHKLLDFERSEMIEAILELLRQLASKKVPQDIETYLRSEENMESLYKCLVAAMGVQAIRNFRKRCIKMNS